jgi:hypothetical protein
MATHGVIYDFHDEGIKPFLFIIQFAAGELDWTDPLFYVPLEAPFQRQQIEDLEEAGLSLSVHLEDLTVNPLFPQCFGIHIHSLVERYATIYSSLQDVERLVVRMCDIEEALQTDVRRYYV